MASEVVVERLDGHMGRLVSWWWAVVVERMEREVRDPGLSSVPRLETRRAHHGLVLFFRGSGAGLVVAAKRPRE